MSEFEEGDKVIYTDSNGAEWSAEVKSSPVEKIDGKEVVVISMNGGWPIYVAKESVRTTNRTKKVIANDLVRKLKKIEAKRSEIHYLYSEVKELMEEDGQPGWETKMVEDMQTTQRNVLRYETVNLISQWEGYRDARKE